MQKDITVIGAAIIDILVGPVNASVFQTGSQAMERTNMSFGGDALNEAIALSRMGKRVQLISKVGNDEAGARVLDYMEGNGLDKDDVVVEENLTTGMNIVLLDEKGERYFLTNPTSSLRKLAKEDVLPKLDTAADIVCLASIFVSPLLDLAAMEHLFKEIKLKSGRILVADMTKAKNGETLNDLKCILPYIDYILPNQDEIALLTGETDPEVNARLLVEAGASCAVIKCGSKGCVIGTKEEVLHIGAYPVEQVVDTTGAGDCFAAGFLYALSNGYSLAECGKFACATASCAVEVVGATEGIYSVEKPMERYQVLNNL